MVMPMINPKLILDENSPKEAYNFLYQEDVDYVFEVSSGYETVMRRIQEYKPENISVFEVFPITPGTSLFIMYGPNHCVITDKTVTG